VDAAHLKSAAKGMIQVYSALTATNETYILAFAIAAGNESQHNWDYSNRLFKQACPNITRRRIRVTPTLLEEEDSGREDNNIEEEEETRNFGYLESDSDRPETLFVSDRGVCSTSGTM